MKTSMNQVLLMLIMLKHTLVNRNIGSVKLASVMLWNCLAATLVSVGWCQGWTWELENQSITTMVGVSTAKPNCIRSVINLKTWSWIRVDYQSFTECLETLDIHILPWGDEMADQSRKRIFGNHATWCWFCTISETIQVRFTKEGHTQIASCMSLLWHDQVLEMWSQN